jgi:hypothetical protein
MSEAPAPEVSMTASMPTGESKEAPPPHETKPEPDWFMDENTPGVGPRPPWLPPNYKRVSDVVKSNVELEKRLGGFKGAPEEYNLGELEIDEDQLVISEMKRAAKKHHMSEDALKDFIGVINTAAETQANMGIEEEVKKLGSDGERQLQEFQNWTENYFAPEEREVAKEMVQRAEHLQVFNKMMAGAYRMSVPTSTTMAMANQHETVAELRKEMVENIKKYETDKSYAKNFSTRLAQAVARESR